MVTYAQRNKVAACAKHFVGDGGTARGIDRGNTVMDAAGLFRIHMPACIDAVSRGVSTIMVSYSSWNGIKMHANHDLVTGFLKNTLQFKVNFLTIELPQICLQTLSTINCFYHEYLGLCNLGLAGTW